MIDPDPATAFAERTSKHDIEHGIAFAPKFDENDLIVCITTDADSGDVLMVAYMNADSLKLSIETGEAHYWSRSRRELWHKGATSGSIQKIVDMRTDCDQDAILIKVRVDGSGASCHLGYNSCFFRSLPLGGSVNPQMTLCIDDDGPVFDPQEVYGKSSDT